MQLFIRLFAAIMLLPFVAAAHGYWIETEGPHKLNDSVSIKLYFGDYEVGERLTGKTLDKIKDIKVFVTMPGGDKQQVEMKQLAGYWQGKFLPTAKGAYIITGINDVREVQDWTKHNLGITRPVQYLKTVYTVGKKPNENPSSLFLDAIATPSSKNKYTVTVSKQGSVLQARKVTVSAFGSSEQVLNTGTDGSVSFTAPKPGIYLIGVEWIDTKPGEFKQKPYETVRHRLDYTIEHK